ncbi:TBC1 domain family member 22B-like isoform X2 [Liolophura sinensis]|uniref:TBC1 domain family member 22B-like isoform X2 n=1 Tax=Liolophura sinensis TaxID=3198878 RepID=UPI0031581178
MSAVSNAGVKDGSKSNFWKKSSNVPGRTHMNQNTRKDDKTKARSNDSFVAFANSTSDAWDDGDDDLIGMANVQMSLRDVQSTAKAVLDHHSKQQVEAGSANDKAGFVPSGLSSPGLGPSSPGLGPGVGVRLNSAGYKPVKTTNIRLGQIPVPDRESTKLERMKAVLSGNTDLNELRKLCWSGIPRCMRATTWKILAGYVPASEDRRNPTLERKRREYFNFIDQYYDTRLQENYQDTFRQISIDIPRMNPLIPLFQQKVVQEIFERILYIWAYRHQASGYVQGINDLVTPFFVIFLSEFIKNDVEVENCDLKQLPEETLRIIEADSFWCTSKLLDGIQDNYTFAQPGIQQKVNDLKELMKRIDAPLHAHLEKHHVEFLQFSFRWMNNLLMREIPLRCIIRLWDTYLSEQDGFAIFHLYVCAAFLARFSKDLLREKDFQGLMMMLQNLPTHHWGNEEIGEVLAEAYKLKYMFADAPNHLKSKT